MNKLIRWLKGILGMEARENQSLDSLENGVRDMTRDLHSSDLACIEDLVNHCLQGFNSLGSITFQEGDQIGRTRIALAARAFNSLRCAYNLLLTGYYSQSITLARSAMEDWLTGVDCEQHPETLDTLLAGERMPPFQEMADRIGGKAAESWRHNYGGESTIAHPRLRALKIMVDPKSNLLNLGTRYDRTLFLGATETVLHSIQLMMYDLMPGLMGDKAPSWMEQDLPILQKAQDWSEELKKAVVEGREPPPLNAS